MTEYVILVNENDQEIGKEEKMRAHTHGLLHRALSVFVFNSNGELLLQKRHPDKYHSGGLWSNTCCSHPRPGENTLDAAHRRLNEEMGVSCDLIPIFSFSYHVQFGTHLYEHEHDHVFVGKVDREPVPNLNEVSATQWISPDSLFRELDNNPDQFTYWFRLIYDRVYSHV